MKIKVETLEEVLGEVETEERFEIILPFLKKISELEEKIDSLMKEYERLSSENIKLRSQLHEANVLLQIPIKVSECKE